jgi:CubicO group peptidase (beta-lactamase class C family)
MMKKPIVFLISLLFVLGFAHSFGQTANDYKQLDNYIQNYTEEYNMPGFAIGIIKNGNVVFEHAYAYKNTDTKDKVDENTLFGIASCSKAFTAACISILVDRGQLHWDDKVVDVLPGFKLSDPEITANLTIEDILAHRSGFETFDGDLIWYGTQRSTEEVVRRIRYREIPYGLREKFGYSNLMFITAGEVIKSVTGMPWTEFLKENILDKIDMDLSTTSNRGFENNENAAWPHIDGKPMEFINYDNISSAGAINSSVNDMLHWLKLMLGKGVYEGDTIFTKSSYYHLVSPQTLLNAGRAETPDGTHFAAYGQGWFLKDYQGMKVIYHGGGLPGFHSKVVLVPEDSLAYVILANQLSAMIPAIDKKVLDFFLNRSDTTDWAAKYLVYEKKQKQSLKEKWGKLAEQRVKNTKPSLDLEKYTGEYNDEMYGDARVELVDNELYLTLIPTAKLLNSKLEHWHYDTFKIKFADPFLPPGFVTFSLNSEGDITGFKIDMDAPDFHFGKLDFVKK